MEKLYERQIFKNNDIPAINETNLNILTKALDDVDTRVTQIATDVVETIPEIKELAEQVVEIIEATEENANRAEEKANESEASALTSLTNSNISKDWADVSEDWANKAEQWAKQAQTTSVIVDQIETSGTHIADITVNGAKTEIYAPQGGGSASELVNLTDVNIASPNNDEALVYNSNTQKWENKNVKINTIDNLDSTSTNDALSANQGRVIKEIINNNILGADVFIENKGYVFGEICIDNNKLWQCINTSGFQGTTHPTEGTNWRGCSLNDLGGVRFGIDGDGNYGYYKADDSFNPFNSISLFLKTEVTIVRNTTTVLVDGLTKKPDFVLISGVRNSSGASSTGAFCLLDTKRNITKGASILVQGNYWNFIINNDSILSNKGASNISYDVIADIYYGYY